MLAVPAIVLLSMLTGHGFRADLSAAANYPVYCRSLAEYGFGQDRGIRGTALIEQQRIVLAPETCRDFDRGGMRTIDAVSTLAHERQHLLGVTDEQEAECEAIWDVRWLGKRLGYQISRGALKKYAGSFYASCVS